MKAGAASLPSAGLPACGRGLVFGRSASVCVGSPVLPRDRLPRAECAAAAWKTAELSTRINRWS